MPRIRSIKPEIWQDEALGRCTIPARLLYVGLITQADDEGRLRGAPELIRALVFPYGPDEACVENIELWLTELEIESLVARYTVRTQSYIAVMGWCDHQKISHPVSSKLPAPVDIPEDSGGFRKVPEDSGKFRPDQGSRIKEGNAPPEAERPEIQFLCSHLAELIRTNDPRARVTPSSAGWRNECRRLIDIDGRTPTEIQAVMEWATTHEFWRANILSMPTLRKQFSRLWLQMQERKGNGARSDDASFFAAITRQGA